MVAEVSWGPMAQSQSPPPAVWSGNPRKVEADPSCVTRKALHPAGTPVGADSASETANQAGLRYPRRVGVKRLLDERRPISLGAPALVAPSRAATKADVPALPG